jgi:hypothetical protein
MLYSYFQSSQRINPIEGSTVSIQTSKVSGDDGGQMIHQTGYKSTVVGTVLHVSTVLTFFGWFALQIVCTLLYLLGYERLMALRTFNACWLAGLFWNFSLLWPHSIGSLFLRRCVLSEATHVAIFHETQEKAQESKRVPSTLMSVARKVQALAHTYFTLIFADPHCRPDLSKGIFQYCPVFKNEDQSRYILFLFRRYNFSLDRRVFLVGTWPMAKKFRELVPPGISVIDEIEAKYNQITFDDNSPDGIIGEPGPPPKYHLNNKGLSTREVQERFQVVGPNVLNMESPSLFRVLVDEVAKPFYLYQIYMVWTWVCIDYLYAGGLYWLIVLMTACIVSWFKFRGAQLLFSLSQISGQATVLRDGNFVTVGQVNLVPGDIVKVAPGVIHCDMLLLTGETVVDESALSGEATPHAKSTVDPHSDEEYDVVLHKKHTLSAGTDIIECDHALALVIKTGSNTTKGDMMRHVLAFRNHHLKFQTELPMVFAILMTYSTIFFFIILFNSSDILIVAWFLAV